MAVFAVAGLFLFSSSASAATYYVRGAATCTSNGDGTTADCAASPGGVGAYNSIGNAFAGRDLAPGDIIEVQADSIGGSKTFSEAITWGSDDNGDATGQVSLQGRIGDAIIIDCTGNTRCIQFAGKNNVTIKNINATGSTQAGFYASSGTGQVLENIACTGTNQDCIYAYNLINLTIDGVTSSGQSRYGVYVGGVAPTPSGLTIGNVNVAGGGVANAYGGITIFPMNNIVVNGDLTQTGTVTSGVGILFRDITGTITINDGVTITSTNADNYGMWFRSVSATLNCDGKLVSTGATSSGIQFTSNTFGAGSYISRIEVNNSSNINAGLALEQTSNITFKSFDSHSNAGNGVWVAAASGFYSDIVFTSDLSLGYGNSLIYDNAGDGFGINNDVSVTLEKTKIYSNGGGGIPGSEGDGITGHLNSVMVARNNIIYDNDNTCFAFINTSSLTAYNNICYSNGVAGGPRGAYYNTGTGITVVKNNIFSENLPFEISVTASHLGASPILDNNVYYHPSDGNFADTNSDDTADYATLVLFSSGESQDVNSVESNPLFANIGSFDFNLQSTSPAIDAGIDLNISTDYSGNSRYDMPSITNTGNVGSYTKNYVDIGAYEYITPPTPALNSSTHPSTSTWYSAIAPVTMAFDAFYDTIERAVTTDFKYLINQTLSPTLAAVKAGTALNDLVTFDASGSIATDGTWYIHAVAQNENNTTEYSTNYDTYTVKYDSTAPTGTSLNLGAITASSITATVSGATDADAGLHATPYYFDRNSAAAVSDWQAGTTWADSGLTSNTQYTYKVKARDAAASPNVSDFTATQAKYTLAPTPTNLAANTVGQTAITLSVDAINNPTADSSGYYFANTTNSTNSGWIQTNIWQDTSLTCGTSYNYTIKYRNGDGTETNTAALTKSTSACGGTPAWFLQQINQQNQQQNQTGDQDLVNNIEAADDAEKQAVQKFTDKIAEIISEAAEVFRAKVLDLLALVGLKRNLNTEQAAANKYLKPLLADMGKLTDDAEHALNNFIAYGTPTTKVLGEGERAGTVNSYKLAFGKLPTTQSDWEDVIKIANGRWPSERSEEAEERAKTNFKIVYLREPDRNNPHDDAAITVMAYGLRSAQRNIESEKAAIKIFKAIYGYNPENATAWDVVRAIAYSGAVR